MASRLLRFNTQWVLAACVVMAGQFAVAGDEPKVIRLSEPVEVTDTHETFGAAMPASADPVPLATLLEHHEDYIEKSVAIEARVSEVCQNKGCFFIAKDVPQSYVWILRGLRRLHLGRLAHLLPGTRRHPDNPLLIDVASWVPDWWVNIIRLLGWRRTYRDAERTTLRRRSVRH